MNTHTRLEPGHKQGNEQQELLQNGNTRELTTRSQLTAGSVPVEVLHVERSCSGPWVTVYGGKFASATKNPPWGRCSPKPGKQILAFPGIEVGIGANGARPAARCPRDRPFRSPPPLPRVRARAHVLSNMSGSGRSWCVFWSLGRCAPSAADALFRGVEW